MCLCLMSDLWLAKRMRSAFSVSSTFWMESLNVPWTGLVEHLNVDPVRWRNSECTLNALNGT